MSGFGTNENIQMQEREEEHNIGFVTQILINNTKVSIDVKTLRFYTLGPQHRQSCHPCRFELGDQLVGLKRC